MPLYAVERVKARRRCRVTCRFFLCAPALVATAEPTLLFYASLFSAAMPLLRGAACVPAARRALYKRGMRDSAM